MEWIAFFTAAVAVWMWRKTSLRVTALEEREREREAAARSATALARAPAIRRQEEETPAALQVPPVVEAVQRRESNGEGQAEARPRDDEPAEPVPTGLGQPTRSSQQAEFTQEAVEQKESSAWWTGVDWESWLGVKGAGALGGVVLALAGIYFFKYSIEHGLISPGARVTLGVLVGLACVGSSELVLRKRYAINANAVAGAGLVILYASFWAARALYALIPFAVAFVAMMAVTAAACALSIRHQSLLVAMLGLAGGFATPLLLSTGEDKPIPLFGYLLVLDAAVLYIAHKRGWKILSHLSLGLTAVYQAYWIFDKMGPERLVLGLVIVGAFALLYARFARGSVRTQAAAIMLPFVFALYFAGDKPLSPHFYPLAALLLLLLLAARFIPQPHLFAGASAAALATTLAWMASRQMDAPLAWEFALATLVLGATAYKQLPILPLGLQIVLTAACSDHLNTPWPWLIAHVALAVFVRGNLAVEASSGALLGIGLGVIAITQQPPLTVFLALIIGATVVIQALGRSYATLAAVGMLLILSLDNVFWRTESTVFYHAFTLLLALLAGIAAARLEQGLGFLIAVCELALVHTLWMNGTLGRELALHPDVSGFLMQVVSVIALTAWPFVARRRFQKDSYAWYAAALAGPLYFHSLRKLFEAHWGTDVIAVLPLGLGALSLSAASFATKLWNRDDPRRQTSLAWFGAVALCFVSVAIPLQLEKQWITIGWAVEGAAVLLLWRRLHHVGLMWFGTALLTAAAIRLTLNPAVLDYYPRGTQWLLYSYWVPAACMLAAAFMLKNEKWPSIITGAAAALTFFAWINLAIADHFSTADQLELDFSRMPARELTRSICWAIYAVMLLAAGVWQRSRGLRWMSLVMLYVTIAKVFFWDLSELGDLYRVMSLVGAAVALIIVSLAYQRFVFRRDK